MMTMMYLHKTTASENSVCSSSSSSSEDDWTTVKCWSVRLAIVQCRHPFTQMPINQSIDR